MAEIAFYHLTRRTAAEALPALLAKTLDAGKKALVCSDKAEHKKLSTAIWSHVESKPAAAHGGGGGRGDMGEGSWLPHGLAGRDEEDARLCPIWITDNAADNPIAAEYVFFAGAVGPEIPEGAARVFILFDGRDDEAVARARENWKAFSGGGDNGGKPHSLRYLQQNESGGWSEKKA